jgi:hypothetical protein
MGRLCVRKAILSAACLLLVCRFSGAQQADRPASVIVAVVPGTGADPAFQSILREALMVTLTRNRMKSTGAETPDDARAAARQKKVDYLVLGTWQNTTEALELSVEVWLPEGAAPLATGKASGRISLSMDAVAGEALAPVLPSMQARFPADPATTAAATSGTGTGTAASGAVDATVGTTGGTTGTVTAIGPSDAGTGIPEPPARWRRVELAIGGAPLVNTGTVAEYAKIGVFSALDLDLRFPVGRSVLAPGLLASAGWFRAVGVGVADILVVPVGPDFHWTIAAGGNPGVSLHIAAGPAAIVAITSWANTVWKISPFVAGGLDVDIGLTPALGLRIEAEYTVVFEGSMVLQGFTPRLSLRTRF